MKMRTLLCAAVLALCAPLAYAGDFQCLTGAQTFAAPYVAGGPVSNAIANPNGLSKIEVFVEYTALVPDRETAVANYAITATLESQDQNGAWHPIANDVNGINKLTAGPVRLLKVSPGFDPVNSGVPFVWQSVNGLTSQIDYAFQGTAGADMRIRFDINPETSDPPVTGELTSFTAKCSGRTFD